MAKKSGVINTVTLEAGGRSVTMSAENFQKAAAGVDIPEKEGLDGVLRPVVARALGKEPVSMTTDARIVDTAVLRYRAQALNGSLKGLAKLMTGVADLVGDHELSGAAAKVAGRQTMLFDGLEEATLRKERDLLTAVEEAMKALEEALKAYEA